MWLLVIDKRIQAVEYEVAVVVSSSSLLHFLVNVVETILEQPAKTTLE